MTPHIDPGECVSRFAAAAAAVGLPGARSRLAAATGRLTLPLINFWRLSLSIDRSRCRMVRVPNRPLLRDTKRCFTMRD